MPDMKPSQRSIQISQPDTGEEEWLALKESIMSGWLTSGPKVRKFETLFAERHEVKHAVACSSATTALHLALAALEIGPGDEVIVPAFTWIATANVVIYQGAKPVFADIDLNTFNLDPESLVHRITAKTKAIIPVHLFGLCTDMDAIQSCAPNISIIEDAACASGASYHDRPAGGLGDIGCFSFHPRKSITTGEGGMITSNNDQLADKMRILRNHGASISEEERHSGPHPHILPEFNILGFNYRMTDLLASVGIVQLGKLDKYIEERQKYAEFYSKKLKDIPWLRTPQTPIHNSHGWQSYVTIVDEDRAPMSRNEIMDYLQSKGISSRPGTHAVHMLKYYKDRYGIEAEDFPNAYKANNQSMAIPIHNKMTIDDFEYVVDCLQSLNQR